MTIPTEPWALWPKALSFLELRPNLLIDLKESELVKLISEISLKFTSQRNLIGDYVLTANHVSAYTAFYLPTNIPKLYFLLSQLPPSVLKDLFHRDFIDMGSGPGTYTLAFHFFRSSMNQLNFQDAGKSTAVDSSSLMLDQAKKLMQAFFPSISFKTAKKFEEKSPESILFFGHSINEMGFESALKKMKLIDPYFIIWIEPATKDLFPKFLKLKEELSSDYDILYPCLGNSPCPNSWCHQVLRTTHDSSIERLSQLVSLDRKILPILAHVYRKKDKDKISLEIGNNKIQKGRVIRFIDETKFSFNYEICFFENEENKNRSVEILKKHLTKDQVKKLKNFSVGNEFVFEIEKIVNDKLRIRLT